MKVLQCFCLIVVLGFTISPIQAESPKKFSPLEDDIMEFIPPLSVLLDSAILVDPYVRFRNIQVMVEECKVKSAKNDWTQHLNFQAELRNGTYESFTSSGGTTLSSPSMNSFRWNYSTYITVPLKTFINRNNQVRQSKLEKEEAVSLLEVQNKEVRLAVVRQYNDLILKQKLLKILSRTKETQEISIQLGEKSFANATLPMSEYALITENYSRAAVEFATAEVEFQNSYQLLEILCGMKFNLTTAVK